MISFPVSGDVFAGRAGRERADGASGSGAAGPGRYGSRRGRSPAGTTPATGRLRHRAAPPGTSLADVISGWHGSRAALASYLSRVMVTNGVDAGVLAAAAVTDVTGAWSGLMEGALRSGRRAADEVLAAAG